MTPKECEQIYKEAYRAVYWTALALMKNEADAEDVVQETFVTLIEKYDTLQDKSKVVPWLKKICANKCLNLLTRTKTQAMEQEFFDNLEAVPEDFLPESIVESQEKRKIIMDIIERALSEDVRRTIILYYFDEMSTKEIAEAMGVPQGTVLWRLSFARMKIKKEVEKYEKDNDIKLYAVALPFLTLLFIKESEQVPIPPMSESLEILSASKETAHSGAAKTIVSETLRKGTGIAMKKLLLALIAFVLMAIAIVAAFLFTNRDDNSGKGKNNKNNTTQSDDNKDPANTPGDNQGNSDPDNYNTDNNTPGSDTPTPIPTIDVDNFDWESIYKWDGTTIVGINEPLDEALKNTGIMVIPARCETIAGQALGERPWVKEVRFETPEKVTMIENNAFYMFRNLHSFVMPPNSNLFQEGEYWQQGTDPFAGGTGYSYATKLHNIVLPNGQVAFYFLRRLGNESIALPENNQAYLERVFVPENFSIRYNDPKFDAHCFAKYTKEFYEADYTYYTVNGCEEFPDKPCTVYVVRGSWADENFDEWTFGDLIVKDYWDGVNYTFAEYDPLWDVEDIRIYTGEGYTIFDSIGEDWKVRTFDGDRNKIYEGYLNETRFEELYREVTALIDAGDYEQVIDTKCGIAIFQYGELNGNKYEIPDVNVLKGIVAKYAK
ncbi:MAG: sigma-70 family RNA polymerase sigma factor [Lachnospiraceae bacterium]|nr:sigma-70 family RNA polymerase sigma factor [Lachnospiraceae bacterium]